MIDPQQVRDAVARKHAPGVRELLRDATEAERRAAAKDLAPLLRDDPAMLRRLFPDVVRMQPGMHGVFVVEDYAGGTEEARQHEEIVRLRNSAAFLVAALGLAGGVAAAAKAAQDFEPDHFVPLTEEEMDAVAGVLADRRPPWLAEFIDRHLTLHADSPLGVDAWPLARTLVRLGAIGRPEAPAYTTLMPRALLVFSRDDHDWRLTAGPAQTLPADPDLLAEEVWRLFTVPDAAWALHRADEGLPPEQTWADGLATLAAQGLLDRDRLIDACLGAFLRDFPPTRVGWYERLHERLDPSLPERAARAQTYLAMLSANSAPGVKIGQHGVRLLLEAGLLEPGRLAAASAAALLHPRKNIVLEQLKILSEAMRRHPDRTDSLAVAVAQAFRHERDDVQQAALTLLGKHMVQGSATAHADIARLAGSLSPSLAAKAQALGLTSPARSDPAHPAGAPADAGAGGGQPMVGTAALSDALHAGPPNGARRVRDGQVRGPATVQPASGAPLPGPVTEPEELVELFTTLMEDASDPIAVERALAGAVRLGGLPLDKRRAIAGPLCKRAMRLALRGGHEPFSGTSLSADVAFLVLSWGTGWLYRGENHPYGLPDPRLPDTQRHVRRPNAKAPAAPRSVSALISTRIWEAAFVIAAGHAAGVLAEPEFERGAISPGRLLDRLSAWRAAGPGRPRARHDLEMAMLRLGGDADGAFWREWARLDPSTADRARQLHAEAREPLSFAPMIGSSGWERGEAPHVRALARLDGERPAAVSRAWRLLTKLSAPARDHGRLYGARWERPPDAAVATWPLACPWQPELAAAHLLLPLSDGLRPGRTPAVTALACLGDPGHPLGPIGHLALVAGLASAEPETRIAAGPVWAQACLDGRLVPALAAEAIVTGSAGKAFKLNRLADGLRQAASQPLASYRAVETTCLSAPALIDQKAANLHELLGLAARLGAGTGLPGVPAALRELARRPGGTRLNEAAALLASAADGPAPDRAGVVAQSIAALAGRAESR